jgi:hypothetical protein
VTLAVIAVILLTATAVMGNSKVDPNNNTNITNFFTKPSSSTKKFKAKPLSLKALLLF